MAEKTVPWWRRALQFALGGIRSGFGLLKRGGKPGEAEADVSESGVGAGEAGAAKAGGGIEIPAEPQWRVIEIPPESEGKEEADDLAAEIALPATVGGTRNESASNLEESEAESGKIETAEEPVIEGENKARPIAEEEIAEERVHEDLIVEEPIPEATVGGEQIKEEEEKIEEEGVREEIELEPTPGVGITDEPVVGMESREDVVEETHVLEAAAEADEVEAGPLRGEVEAEWAEQTATTEPVVAQDATIEEPVNKECAEELETVDSETGMATAGANAPEEERTEEAAATARTEEPVASEQSSDADAADVEEPVIDVPVHADAGEAEGVASEAPIVVHAEEHLVTAAAESAVGEANVAEAHEDLAEEPAHVLCEVVNIDASGEMVEAHIAEHAEDLLAQEAATATHTEDHEAKQSASMEEFDTTTLAQVEQQVEREGDAKPVVEAEANLERGIAVEAEPETVVEAAAEAAAVPAQMELIPKPPVDEKAAAKLAEQQKRRKQAEEESPFSVMVGQVYEGPLDLLLDLIRKQDIDIYDIPIAKITAQFLAYVNQLKASDVDVAGEFIYTASLLIHIKSKMLLPRTVEGPGEAAEDPRRELVERLLEHERFKNAAQMLQQKQMMEAASWSNPGQRDFVDDEGAEPEIAADTVDLVRVFREILERARNRPVLDVAEDTVTVGQMIRFLGRRLMMEDKPIALRKLLSHTRSERALIAMFLALLELVRLQAVLLRQDKAFSEIFIKKHAAFETVMDEGLANARDDWR